MNPPLHIDVRREEGITITWADGRTVFYPVEHLRRLSPSAEARQLREKIARNPLVVLPASNASHDKLSIVEAELRGNYAIWLRFSDGHSTGIYSWEYLREIEPPTSPSCQGTRAT
jgi:DUF971 family protein